MVQVMHDYGRISKDVSCDQNQFIIPMSQVYATRSLHFTSRSYQTFLRHSGHKRKSEINCMKIEYDVELDGLYIWFVKDIDKESDKYSRENRSTKFAT